MPNKKVYHRARTFRLKFGKLNIKNFNTMSLLTVGSVAFDAIETPFGKTDKIVGGAASYIALCTSYFAP
jgi:hypothetical protein